MSQEYCSASVRSRPYTLAVHPTEAQNATEVHELPARYAVGTFAGVGLDWIAHVTPSQTSTSVDEPEALVEPPTATQDVMDRQDRPFRRLIVVPVGTGADWLVHDAPFHDSASGCSLAPTCSYPTVIHDAAVWHTTS